ncbi:MAG: FtsW/RodA/SpoVE family cell cycle protein, partial [Aliifodinibius sp.]|nr:FtsW/RodA/SpoVE family cell cycle protein [Fodinibius sp.]
AVARFLSNEYHNINQIKTFFIACAIILLPFALILRQPDLGTALVFAVITLPLFYWAGLAPRNLLLILVPVCVMIASFNYYTFFAVMILLAVYLVLIKPSVLTGLFHFVLNIGVGLITPILWNHLEDYQRERIKIFLNPEADPLGGGYQIIQSKVAIGSGGLIGKGFLQGSQTQLRFLPEQHTDFIYAVIGEEFGFMGVIIGLILFALFLFRAVHIANISKSRFNSLVAIGTATIICFHMFVNIGMTVGLFPVTGLPLPFISYGGSALLSNLIMVGLLLNFYRHRYKY